MKRTRWYKDKVFYQIWPRSFKDGNGDGMGDLYGVIEKLDYLQDLEIDGIWFSPLYPSPGVDCGYDISDYYDIDPMFGGMEAFDRLLKEAHERGMKVIMDLVVNHTSDEHEWFKKSRRREDPYTDYYIWRPVRANGKLPNNWDSEFEGKAWQWDEIRKEYYLHTFAIRQPDLNMDNPLVRNEVKKILRFWLDKGIDGFREDVITYISKPVGLPNDYLFPIHKGLRLYNHGPFIHDYLKEFRNDVLNDYDCVTLAEAPLISPRIALQYTKEAPDAEIDMMIQFQCMCADCFLSDYMPLPFSLRKMKRAFSKWQHKMRDLSWNMLYLENHDHPRIISRYGSEKYRVESGKMLAAMYMLLQGTPFVYQGQEIGMLNWRPSDISMYEDVQTLNYAKHKSKEKRLKIYHRSSRDSARTPVQWSGEKHAGFSTVKPWFYVNENYKDINVEKELADPNSILNFYKKLIPLRKSLPVVKDGTYKEYYKFSSRLYVYTRELKNERLLVICSFSEKPARFKAPASYDLSNGELLLKNYPENPLAGNGFTSRPYELRVYYYNK